MVILLNLFSKFLFGIHPKAFGRTHSGHFAQRPSRPHRPLPIPSMWRLPRTWWTSSSICPMWVHWLISQPLFYNKDSEFIFLWKVVSHWFDTWYVLSSNPQKTAAPHWFPIRTLYCMWNFGWNNPWILPATAPGKAKKSSWKARL